jgi:ABC-type polysaccharide/polyol phosphate transport system ATPase subunit
VIEINNVSKKFPMVRGRQGFKEFIVNFHKNVRSNGEGVFYALDDVSMKIPEGECVGLIGGNGAGKSTLLSLILGTTTPTSGEVRVKAVPTPLIELGAGFHPDLTGKENAIINGVLLGLTRKEIEQRMGSIIDFSEIGRFANMPARTYSSGMYMRLAFSIAIHTDPKILLIDEILAVGDESFHYKSRDALINLISSGVTTVFVSHNLGAVKEICHRTIWLDHGKIRMDGSSDATVEAYKHHL